MHSSGLLVRIGAAACLVAAATSAGAAQATPRVDRPPSPVVSPDSSPACCTIVRIDSARSRVTARELATGFTFVFTVESRRVLRGLRLGRPVWADFSRRTVRLSANESVSCCTMLPQP